ncbi:MAG: PssE/Cps14G family polysaccharide biosynthesis glycosyltransferase [Spirochaetota bacterium]|nr:PssE/Cps14G family polysaccharide biosynthesis glycosyltransferase [Spirochaetota bacterium]
MIFVITGTEKFPFDRLIQEVDSLKSDNILKDDVYVQLGSCKYEPIHCAWDRYITFNEMRNNIQKAETVIAHAGAGTTLLCLELGKTPIIVTRLKKYGEHLDDHQVPFARMMQKLNYVIVAYEVGDLRDCIENLNAYSSSVTQFTKDNTKLVNHLNSLIQA